MVTAVTQILLAARCHVIVSTVHHYRHTVRGHYLLYHCISGGHSNQDEMYLIIALEYIGFSVCMMGANCYAPPRNILVHYF